MWGRDQKGATRGPKNKAKKMNVTNKTKMRAPRRPRRACELKHLCGWERHTALEPPQTPPQNSIGAIVVPEKRRLQALWRAHHMRAAQRVPKTIAKKNSKGNLQTSKKTSVRKAAGMTDDGENEVGEEDEFRRMPLARIGMLTSGSLSGSGCAELVMMQMCGREAEWKAMSKTMQKMRAVV